MQLKHLNCRASCEFQQMKLCHSNTLIMQVIVVCSVWLGKKPRNDCIRIYVYNYVYNYALLVQCSGCPCKLLAAIETSYPDSLFISKSKSRLGTRLHCKVYHTSLHSEAVEMCLNVQTCHPLLPQTVDGVLQ